MFRGIGLWLLGVPIWLIIKIDREELNPTQ